MQLKDAFSLKKSYSKCRQHIKSRSITLLIKVYLVKGMVFLVATYRCESWTIKKAERRRTDAFQLWCWRRLLRIPWTARSNESVLKEINPEYSLEGLMLKRKLQYFGHLMGWANSLEKTLMLEKIEGSRRRGWQDEMASLTQWAGVWVDSRRWWRTGRPGVLPSMGSQSQASLSDWKTTNTLTGPIFNIVKFVHIVSRFIQLCLLNAWLLLGYACFQLFNTVNSIFVCIFVESIVGCIMSLKACWNHNPLYLWMQPYLETVSLWM